MHQWEQRRARLGTVKTDTDRDVDKLNPKVCWDPETQRELTCFRVYSTEQHSNAGLTEDDVGQ